LAQPRVVRRDAFMGIMAAGDATRRRIL